MEGKSKTNLKTNYMKKSNKLFYIFNILHYTISSNRKNVNVKDYFVNMQN